VSLAGEFGVAGPGSLWKSPRVLVKNLFAALLLAWMGAGCVGPVPGLFPPVAGVPKHAVYVVNHGWHTGLVLPRAELPAGLLPEAGAFATGEYLEFGWGEDGFYRAKEPGVVDGAKAFFWRNKSVLHVVGFRGPPGEYFPDCTVVRVELSKPGLVKLCAFVQESFAHDAAGKTLLLGPGLYGESKFYRATGSYYFPEICNVWTARALRQAGCPITPACAISAGNVMFQTRRFGTVVPPMSKIDTPAAAP